MKFEYSISYSEGKVCFEITRQDKEIRDFLLGSSTKKIIDGFCFRTFDYPQIDVYTRGIYIRGAWKECDRDQVTCKCNFKEFSQIYNALLKFQSWCETLPSEIEEKTSEESNLIFVKHENSDTQYLFQLPANIDLTKNQRVICNTQKGDAEGITTSANFRLHNEDALNLISACGAYLPLKMIKGHAVKETKTVCKPFCDCPF